MTGIASESVEMAQKQTFFLWMRGGHLPLADLRKNDAGCSKMTQMTKPQVGIEIGLVSGVPLPGANLLLRVSALWRGSSPFSLGATLGAVQGEN